MWRWSDRVWTGRGARWAVLGLAVSPGVAHGFHGDLSAARTALLTVALGLLVLFGAPFLVMGWRARWTELDEQRGLIHEPSRVLRVAAVLGAVLWLGGIALSVAEVAPTGGIAAVGGFCVLLASDLSRPVSTHAAVRAAPPSSA